MCLIAFAIGAGPTCPLLIAANRDEFFDRPTQPLHRWRLQDGTVVVGGRDLRDGGTWLGVSESGRVAMLTNVRSGPPGPSPRSRGELVSRWLQGSLDWQELQGAIDPAAYGGFNLVVGDFHQGVWGWLSNRDPAHSHQSPVSVLHGQTLVAGVYGLSNAALDTPWPKTLRLKHALSRALERLGDHAADGDDWMEPLTGTLADDGLAEEHELPATGLPADHERALSSPFVRLSGGGYGTRSSLVLRAAPAASNHDAGARSRWRVAVHEWTHTPASAAARHAWNRHTLRTETVDW